MDNVDNSTTRDDSPVFKNWSSWYWLVVIVNLIVVTLIYLYFNSL